MRPDRIMWGAGLTLAGAVLAGLVLNLATGLTRLSWTVAVAIAMVAVAGVAYAVRVIRRRGAAEAAHAPRSRRGFRPSPVTSGFLLLAAVLAGGAVWLANASAGWQHSSGFAQLWLTPATDSTSTLGVRDSYPGQQVFQLVLRDGGKTIGTWDLSLTEGQAWQQTVARPAGSTLTATLDVPGQTLEVTA